MPRGTVDEFLQVVSRSKRVQFFEILSHHRYKPGEGSLNKTSRVDKHKTPYEEVLHVLRRNALLGASYEGMVNKQRGREAEAALAELTADLPSFVTFTPVIEPFIADFLWGGHGERDPQFPKLAARHKTTGQRYLVFWPASDASGKPMNNESVYQDQDGTVLDFKTQVQEYWRLPSVNKSQGTEKPTAWQTVKFENIVQIKAGKLVWDFEPEAALV